MSIDVIETAKSKIPLRACMKNGTLPRYPFSIMMSGRSGSGKTNLLLNLMTKREFYGNYFHEILVFSPTAGSYDDSYKKLNIPDKNFIKDFDKKTLDNIINYRKNLIDEKGIEWVAKNNRLLIILDDIIANRSFLESPEALKMFALLRHYLVSVIVLIQSYTKLPRALRLNCNAVMVFPCLMSEKKVLIEEVCPSNKTKKEFSELFNYATKGQYDFLYINNHAKPDNRIRKNLDEILN